MATVLKLCAELQLWRVRQYAHEYVRANSHSGAEVCQVWKTRQDRNPNLELTMLVTYVIIRYNLPKEARLWN